MKIGLIDVDGHNFPNFAIMKISAWHKSKGDAVEWYDHMFGGIYDIVYMSKIFTFTPDYCYNINAKVVVRGGTGYDIKKHLPKEIDDCTLMDYSIYPQFDFSLQFFSRGCIRHCPFCLVHDKEGGIQNVKPHQLNPNGKHIEVLDNNFFANPNWPDAIEYIKQHNQPIKLHGVDVRIMNAEQAKALNEIKHEGLIHIAWDLPKLDLRKQITTMAEHVNPNKIACYVLIGYNSTMQQDLDRVRFLKSIGIVPFAAAYRDFKNEKRMPSQYEKDFMRWCNNRYFRNVDFFDFEPRKGFKCKSYFE